MYVHIYVGPGGVRCEGHTTPAPAFSIPLLFMPNPLLGPEPLRLLALEELLEDGLPIAECGSVFHFLLMALGKVHTIPCTTHA